MDVFYYYTCATTGWLAIQATLLIASPTMIVALLSPHVRELTPLEYYLARSLGITLVALGVLAMLLTGSVPLTSTFSDSGKTAGNLGTTVDPTDPKAPYAYPSLTITMVYHGVVAFYSYAHWVGTGRLPFAINAGAGGALAAVGLWCVLFATSGGRISRRTGADKRTSGWPFGNKEADKRKRKGGSKAL